MIPKLCDLLLPILKILKDGKPHHRNEIADILSDQFKLTEEERNSRTQSGALRMRNRVSWAGVDLKCAGLVTRENNIFLITDDGLALLETKPEKFDCKDLENIPKYQEHKKLAKERKKNKPEKNVDYDIEQPDEMIRAGHERLKEELKEEFLEKIKSNKPAFFEQLVNDLLRKMGYGVESKVTGKPGDDGIDGIIKEDKLGLSEIYFQAKRYEDTVPHPQVRDFVGALATKKSKKGIFITTSDFQQKSYDDLKSIDAKIILIDGDQLAEYMYDYNLGVNMKETYHIKTIDEEYFSIL